MVAGRFDDDFDSTVVEIGCKILKAEDYMLEIPKQNILLGSMVYDSYMRDKDVCVVDECGELLYLTRNEENHYDKMSKVIEILKGNV